MMELSTCYLEHVWIIGWFYAMSISVGLSNAEVSMLFKHSCRVASFGFGFFI